MGRLAPAALALMLAIGLAGCGQKGPLYLPGDEQAAERYDPRDAQTESSDERDDTAPQDTEE
ncbi:MAG: lipoprotein [Halomonas sp.]|nr:MULTISPECIES: lipoprotein [Halomonas]NWN82714.1 lipoprotein [Halomonas sp.]